MKQDLIAILDLGSDKNAALARQIRAEGVYSEVYPGNISPDELNAKPNLKGVIFCTDGKSQYTGTVSVPTLMAAPDAFDGDNFTPDTLRSFLFTDCQCEKNWNMENFIADQVELLREQIGDGHVILALSGGVDSSVVAALLIRAIGKQLTCIHVNHGLLRKGEPEQVCQVFRDELDADLVYIDAEERFLSKLSGVSDPEQKRKIIGEEFIRVFDDEAAKLTDAKFLAQGTIYPDIVESGTHSGKSVKAHHNVGGLPEDVQFELVEPLKYLFKDEVRACGKALGLPDSMVYRQPFPGPGLGVRCVGAITKDRLEAVRESDAILREEFDKAGLCGKVWQYFTLIPDFKTVGVRDNNRCDEWPVVIRAVNTVDAMTATIEPLDWELLGRITDRIVHEVPGVNRVLYDITPKPTGTIEWE
ncbi:MAG: glutamine-hydrolyzing GMP synthase [Oscillospiraceae bacterium]|nr:glutamine-hydrolyzing GMP synthase [Oscillospiraceae bacterium]